MAIAHGIGAHHGLTTYRSASAGILPLDSGRAPSRSAKTRDRTLGDGEVYEFYCTNNRELEELQRLRELELAGELETDD